MTRVSRDGRTIQLLDTDGKTVVEIVAESDGKIVMASASALVQLDATDLLTFWRWTADLCSWPWPTELDGGEHGTDPNYQT